MNISPQQLAPLACRLLNLNSFRMCVSKENYL
jgi:hypothetical protein